MSEDPFDPQPDDPGLTSPFPGAGITGTFGGDHPTVEGATIGTPLGDTPASPIAPVVSGLTSTWQHLQHLNQPSGGSPQTHQASGFPYPEQPHTSREFDPTALLGAAHPHGNSEGAFQLNLNPPSGHTFTMPGAPGHLDPASLPVPHPLTLQMPGALVGHVHHDPVGAADNPQLGPPSGHAFTSAGQDTGHAHHLGVSAAVSHGATGHSGAGQGSGHEHQGSVDVGSTAGQHAGGSAASAPSGHAFTAGVSGHGGHGAPGHVHQGPGEGHGSGAVAGHPSGEAVGHGGTHGSAAAATATVHHH